VNLTELTLNLKLKLNIDTIVLCRAVSYLMKFASLIVYCPVYYYEAALKPSM